MKHLRELQLRFQNYLTDGVDDIEQDIVSTADALAEHRLGTYYNAYRIRLIDCLAVDYSALEKFLGREAFENIALDYLQHYPSTHPSVRWFGRNLPAYLQQHYIGDSAEFIQEMASYEWAHSMVFDAAESARLFQLEDMVQVPAEAWPQLRFEFQPAMLWLDLYWNVPLLKTALDAGTELPPQQQENYPQRWLLWRQDMKIHWRSLEVDEAWAIEQAVNGANFAEICAGLLEWIDESQVALVGAGFLKQWVNDKLIASLNH